VSRLWPDELGAYVAPARLCLVRLRRRYRRALVRELELPVIAGGQGDWVGALSALEAKLSEADWSGASLRVVVADHWVRYAALPYSPELSSAEECEAHARALLASTYGDAVNDWQLSLSEAPPGATRIVCAMPRAVLSGLRHLCARTGTRLASVQPQLIAAYNSWRHRIPEDGAWFVTVERGTLAAARVGHNGFERVHTVRIGNDWTREIKRLQIFGRLVSAGAPNGRVFVDAPLAWRPAALPAGPELEWLEENAPPLTTLHRLEHLRRLAA
jgi:hypothetical protein